MSKAQSKRDNRSRIAAMGNARVALQRSERHFRTVFESSPIGVALIGLDCKIQDANRAALRLHGFHAKEAMVGQDWHTLIAQESLHQAAVSWERTLQDGSVQDVELVQLKKSGEQFHTLVTASRLEDESGQPYAVMVMVQDITDRKQAEEFRQSDERLRALMNQNPSLIFLKDEQGRYVYLNEAYETHFVRTKDWQGKTDFDFWPEDSAALFRQNDVRVLQAGTTMQFLEDSTDLEGTRHCWLCYKFPFVDSLNRKFVGGIGIDATRHVLAEEALRESEQRLRIISAAGFEGIAITENETLVEANPQLAEMHGYTLEEILGSSVQTLIHPDDYERACRNMASDEETSGEYRGLKKDGSEITVEVHGQVATWRGRRVRISVLRDITGRKQAEEQLHRQARELRDANEELMWFNKAMVGRELRMVELKKEINALCAELSRPVPYTMV